MTESRSYRGVAQEDRVAARRDALIEAGLDCLHDDGLSGASVRSICARARLTPRYFYENFADLDELLVAVVDAVAAEVATRGARGGGRRTGGVWRRRCGPWSTRGTAWWRRTAARPPRCSLLPPGTARSSTGASGSSSTTSTSRSPTCPRSRRSPDRSARARATALFLMGGAAELIGAVLSGTLRLSRERVVDRLSALWVAVLRQAL